MTLDSFSGVKKETTWKLRPGRTAVLIVDMLNDFLVEGGKMVLPGGHRIVPYQKQLIRAGRKAGFPIIYINDAHRPGLKVDREFLKRGQHCIEGTWGAQVIDSLTPEPEDLIVIKRRFSGFYETDLDLTLKDSGIDTLIVMGVVTNICVRSTIHDAFFRGYQVIVPRDCVEATGPREQESSLYDVETHFGEVTDSAAILQAIKELQGQIDK
jgi:ureidoacrylate peracid hydrolase